MLPEVQKKLNLSPERALMLDIIVREFRDQEDALRVELTDRVLQATGAVYNGQGGQSGQRPASVKMTPEKPGGLQVLRQPEPKDRHGDKFDPRLYQDAEKARRKVKQEGQNDRARLYESVYQKVSRVLTKKQQSVYRKMLGYPFIASGQLIYRPSTQDAEVSEKTKTPGSENGRR